MKPILIYKYEMDESFGMTGYSVIVEIEARGTTRTERNVFIPLQKRFEKGELKLDFDLIKECILKEYKRSKHWSCLSLDVIIMNLVNALTDKLGDAVLKSVIVKYGIRQITYRSND